MAASRQREARLAAKIASFSLKGICDVDPFFIDRSAAGFAFWAVKESVY